MSNANSPEEIGWTKHRESMATLDRELWLQGRLRHMGADLFAGVTDPATRKQRARELIVQLKLTYVIAGRGKNGKAMNFTQAFEQIYGEPL